MSSRDRFSLCSFNSSQWETDRSVGTDNAIFFFLHHETFPKPHHYQPEQLIAWVTAKTVGTSCSDSVTPCGSGAKTVETAWSGSETSGGSKDEVFLVCIKTLSICTLSGHTRLPARSFLKMSNPSTCRFRQTPTSTSPLNKTQDNPFMHGLNNGLHLHPLPVSKPEEKGGIAFSTKGMQSSWVPQNSDRNLLVTPN